jgi:hypothetical protein
LVPFDQIGYSIYIYRFTAAEATEARRAMGLLTLPSAAPPYTGTPIYIIDVRMLIDWHDEVTGRSTHGTAVTRGFLEHVRR